ncbi:Pentatricopeptide repeat-containing protein [Platanthera guangdongensis]|uniref:Pentatricopeptide repeat-containing protein n=1 Tax=Platanthera guangdongensis TaxID=2320717 RepID=A0ABR2N3Y0_9ASPA
MVVRGFLADGHSLRELLFAAAISLRGSMTYARQLFDRVPHPDHFMWNTIIRGAAHTSNPADALCLCIRMERAGTCWSYHGDLEVVKHVISLPTRYEPAGSHIRDVE